MKKMRKIFALLIAMVMVLSMGVSVFAADPTGSITINPAVTDPEAAKTKYEAYKIFDMTTDGTTNADGKYTAVAYTINSAWSDFFTTGAGAAYIVDSNNAAGTLNQIAIGGATKYINITDSNVAEFAKAAYKYAMEKPVAATATKEVDKGTTLVSFTDLALGYYMVYPVGASIDIDSYTSIVSLTSTDPDATIAQKAKYPTLQKTASDISVEVGQTVTYTLTSSVPDTTGYSKYNMVFADKTTDGLTFDGASSITVKIGNNTLAEADYTISTDTEDFTVTINMLKNTGTDAAPVYEAKYTYNDPITVTYTAKVNKDAVTKIDENHATLTYNHNPKDDTEVGTTPPVVVKTYSSKLQIEKVDGSDTSTKLSGAVFVLRSKTPNTNTGETVTAQAGKYYKFTAASGDTPAKTEWITVNPDAITDLITAANNNTITSVTTDENGAASFDGLEDGTYELIEIISPEGYNLVTTPTEVTIAGSDSDDTKLTVTSQVKNNSGSVLPSTGGIGTTIFYVLGAILVIGAGVVLVSRRRMNIQ